MKTNLQASKSILAKLLASENITVSHQNVKTAYFDLKTGSRTPSTTLQLGFYSVGIELTYGVKPKYGSYWMARKGEPTPIVDLSWYTSDRLIRLAEMFNRARYEGLFVPNISNCSLCGYTAHCEWYKKEEDKTNV